MEKLKNQNITVLISGRKFLICIIAILLTAVITYARNYKFLPDYIEGLYREFEFEYRKINMEDYIVFCSDYGLNQNSKENKERYFKLVFLHDLFRGQEARDGSKSEVLGIPYFWNWVKPNPREKIILKRKEKSLSEIKPPSGFRNYKNYATVDRVPNLFLEDLVSDDPQYYFEGVGDFYTFGWCSEKEMAFAIILQILGYSCRINFQGIHVWTQVYCEFDPEGTGTKALVANVDNTFSIFFWEQTSAGDVNNWKDELESGKDVVRYNTIIDSVLEKEKVKSIKVKQPAQDRIFEQVEKYINSRIIK